MRSILSGIFAFMTIAFGARAATCDSIVVAQGVTNTLDSTYGGHYCTNLWVSGTLKANLSGASLYLAPSNSPAWGAYMTSHLAPNVGDEGVMTLLCGTYGGLVGANLHSHLTVGEKGGGDKAALNVGVGDSANVATAHFAALQLHSKATTAADEFKLITIGHGAILAARSIQNHAAKPMVITFTNDCPTAASSSGTVQQFYECALFYPNGADIILRGATNAPIRLKTWDTKFPIFYTWSPAHDLVTDGDCDFIIDIGKVNARLNSAHIRYGHSGNMVIQNDFADRSVPFRVEYANTLPWGKNTGIVRAVAKSGSKTAFLHIDLCGKNQKLNGLSLENGAHLSSTNGNATLTFGDGDANGYVAGNITNETVSCVKMGSGTLALRGAHIRSLVVTGGVLHVECGANVIDSLVISNATIRPGGGTLSVGTWGGETSTHYDLSGGQTNIVYATQTATANAGFVKAGASYASLVHTGNAASAPVTVKGGTLRVGGSVSHNRYWRVVYKRATTPLVATMPDGKTITVALAVSNFGLFDTRGYNLCGALSVASTGTAASSLNDNAVSFSRAHMSWNDRIYDSRYPLEKYPNRGGNPIAKGANYENVSYAYTDEAGVTKNCYDLYNGSNGLSHWWGGALFTNDVLDVAQPSTWLTVNIRLPASVDRYPVTCYNFTIAVNMEAKSQVTDWEIYSSPTGLDDTWELMDAQSNQYATVKQADQHFFCYNARRPYFFTNTTAAAAMRFDTFGRVQVDSGAVLDVSDVPAANVAVSTLAVDWTKGAGTLDGFVPAATGALYLENVPASALRRGYLPHTVDLFTLKDATSLGNLANWKVYLNGVEQCTSTLTAVGNRLRVITRLGMAIIVR